MKSASDAASPRDRRLVITSIDLPYPVNHGHRVDQFNRWQGFAERGWRLRLICWRSPEESPRTVEQMATLARVFESIEVLPINHDLMSLVRRLVRMPRYPSHVASRIPPGAVIRRLTEEARAFAPAAVVNDGIYGARLGAILAEACGVPTILRAHNVEHIYFSQQARTAKRVRDKLAWSIARIGLKRWETAVTNNAAWSFQASANDMEFWQQAGIDRVSWAPPVFPGSNAGTLIPAEDRAYDIAYVGNLYLPNNLKGLEWFVLDVLPLLRKMRPRLSICIAGATPSRAALNLVDNVPEIRLMANAPSADAVLANGRVLINPILSGSGINVKSIEMLRYATPIVTTSVGVQGFPSEIHRQFSVWNTPETFAAAVVSGLDNPLPPAGRAQSREHFGHAALLSQIDCYARVAGVI